MEQKFGINSMDLQVLRDFCEREGEIATYNKGDMMECKGEPSRWFGFVIEGCFKYTAKGMSDNREHITWFSFEGEFVGDYPTCLDGRPSLTYHLTLYACLCICNERAPGTLQPFLR